MFKKLADGFQSTLAQAGEQAKARNAPGVASPRPSTSADRPLNPGDSSGIHVPYEEGNLHSDNDEEKAENGIQSKSDGDSASPRRSTSLETSPELQKRLNKLAKYEKKYPELLKAYRNLQAMELEVKAFEKVLANITPATSVRDVEAFEQWANNYTVKAQMSMTELRRVGTELEALKVEREAEQAEATQTLQSQKRRIEELEAAAQSRVQEEASGSTIEELRVKLSEAENAARAQESTAKVLTDRLQSEKEEANTRVKQLENEIESLRETLKTDSRKVDTLVKTHQRSEAELRNELEESHDLKEKLRQELVEIKVHHAQELRQLRATNPIETGSTNHIPNHEVLPDEEEKEEMLRDHVPLSKGQKKRKNKKKQNNQTINDVVKPQKESEMIPVNDEISRPAETNKDLAMDELLRERDRLQVALDVLQANSDTFEAERASLEKKVKKLSEHQESVEELRDMLKDIGNELVETKDRVKEVAAERTEKLRQIVDAKTAYEHLSVENTALLAKVGSLQEAAESKTDTMALEKELSVLRTNLSTTEEKLRTVSKDLEIAEKLASERYKELSSVRDSARLTLSELNDLKRDNQKLKSEYTGLESTNKTLETKVKSLERAEKDRRDELEKSQKNLNSREKELKVIQTAFKEEEIRRKSEENRASLLKSEVSKLTTLRDSIINSRNELITQLNSMRAELDSTNVKLASLQQIRTKLILERDTAQEELQLGKAKFDSSFSLMESQREQTNDMQHRLRETIERHDAMEEELSDSQRQLTERAREAETLRRLLSEIESNQESRLRDMRERMEVAIAERDKAEDEAAFTGKKRAREMEDLREKLNECERALRKSTIENKDLTTLIEDLTLAAKTGKKSLEDKDKDVRDLHSTMTNLSQSLHDAETQISTLEKDRDSLRVLMKDSANRIERLSADVAAKDDMLGKLRTERAYMLDRQDSSQSPIQTRFSHQRNDSFSSMPGTPTTMRSPSLHSVSLTDRPKEKNEVDREYIKNVLFQFLEHKDKRKYLMPAISKLLMLSKQQEGTFVSALK